MGLYAKFFKRVFDFLFSLLAIIILLPLLVILLFVLLIANKSSPFFFQQRPGRDEKIFWLVKFKSMTGATDAGGNLLPDNERITAAGRFIRKNSLDELPQLLNVLKGDMSIVGPRPLLIKYLPLYSKYQRKRHNVRPGITGWAQVNGRNSISWQEKFKLDVYYVENVRFALDIKIILLTIKKVIKKENISQSAERPMLPFKGNTDYA